MNYNRSWNQNGARTPRRLLHTLALALAVAAPFPFARAATATKAGTGTDLTGATAGVWSGGSGANGSPTNSDTATWISTSLGAGLTLGSPASWGGISVSGALTAIDISGPGSLTLEAGGIDLGLSTVNLSLANPIALDASQTWKAASGKSLTVSGAVSGTAGLTLGAVTQLQSVTNTTFLTTTAQTLFPGLSLSSVLAASGQMGGSFVNSGTPIPGTGYLLSNTGTTANYWLEAVDGTFTKGVKIQLDQVGSDITVKSLSAKFTSGSVLGFNFNTGGSAGTLATTQTGSGYGAYSTILSYAVGGTGIGTITLSGANTYSGGTTLVAGQLNINNGGSSAANSAIGTGPLTIAGGAIDNTSAGDVALHPNNAQNWNADVTYVGSARNLNLGSGAVTLNTNRTVTVSGNKLTVGGSISGSGFSLTKSGAGTLALTGNNTYTGATTNGAGTLILAGTNSYAGGTVISGGQVQVGAGGATGDVGTGPVTTLNIGSPAAPSLVFNRTDNPTFNNTLLTSGGTANNNYWGAAPGTRVNLTGPILATNGFVWFCGPGTFNLANTAANNFSSGVVLCSNAVVEFSAASALKNVGMLLYINAAGGGTFRYTGPTNETLALNPNFGISTGANVFDVSNPATALTLSSTLLNNGGASGITKVGPGTLIMSAASTYTGSTVVSNGTLQVDGSTGTSAITVNGSAALAGSGNIGGAVTVQNNGLLLGTAVIKGAVSVQSGGTLAPGSSSVGSLTVSNTLTLAGGSTSVFRISKTGGTLTNDLVKGMTGTASVTYGGTLRVTNITSDANTLGAGDSFTLFTKTSGSYGGGFASYDLPPLDAGLSWDKSQLTVNGTLTVVNYVATPTFNPPAGGYASALSVTITAEPGATIIYTTDGSDPTTSGTRLSGASPINGVAIPLDVNRTLRAYATNSGFADSPVAAAAYQTLSKPTWITNSSGSWTAGSNWSNNVVADGVAVPSDFSTLTLVSNTTVTLDGARTVGSLVFADVGGAYNWSLNPGTGGALTLDNGGNAPVITVSNEAATIGATLAGASGFVKAGAGILALMANNPLSGGVTVNSGTLILAQTNANNFGVANSPIGSGTLTINSGALAQKTAHFQVSGVNNSGNTSHVAISGGTFDFGAFQEYLRTVDLTGGTLTGTGAADHIIIRAPADLNINSFASATPSTIDGLGSGKLDLTFGNLVLNVADGAAATDLLITTAISENTGAGSGAKSLTKTGAGTLVLAGTNTYTGATTVSNGTLRVDGTLAAGSVVTVVPGATLGGTGTVGGATTIAGTLAPGDSMGTLYFGSTLSFAPSGVAEMQLGDGPTGDKASAAGAVTYGGTLRLTWAGTSPSGGTVDLFDGSSFSGAFTAMQLVNWPSAFRVSTNNLAVDGSIAIAANAAPVAADFTMGVAIGGSASVDVLDKYATDADGDPLTVTVTPPANGTAVVVAGTITYTSTNSAAGDSFSYSVTDPFGASDTKTVTVATYDPQGFNRLSGPVNNGNGTLTLSYLGMPDANYALETASTLTPPILWAPLLTNAAAANGTLSFTIPTGGSQGYFRTRQVP
jgi:autotransporter-associated beta strand protein